MFHDCFNITEIDLSNFNSSEITNMYRLFFYCSSLTSINFTNFITQKVDNMASLFNRCSSLISLDLSNFDTSIVTHMNYMFYNCSSLISLNISNFNTSNTKHMGCFVANCPLLTTLNLSNFDISKVTEIGSFFSGCINLEYINLKNFKEINLTYYENIFNKVPDNVVVCININHTSKIYPQLRNKKCLSIDCSDNWKLSQKQIINETCISVDNHDDYKQSTIEYSQIYYESISNEFISISDNDCNLEKCLICPQMILNNDLCIKCNINFYPMQNDPSNIGEYINCYKELKGYYLDEYEFLFKKCYYKCETCEIKGDNKTNNCLKCNLDFPIGFNINNYLNCFKNCNYYYYFDNDNNYFCTFNNSCPKEYPKLIKDKKECIKNDINNLMKDILKYEKNETKEENKNKKEEEAKYYDAILDNIEEGFTSENYDTTNLDKGEDEIIETEKMKVTFTTTENQKNNIKDNITRINLGECETLLRKYYNLSNNQILYIKKIDVIQENMKIPKLEYDVYCKLSGNNLQKLNKSVCANSKVTLSVPIKISENLDQLNSSSGYYNDICYKATSESGTDISLKDRKKEFVEGNKTVCQDDCDFSDYDYNTQKAICSCKVKESSSSILDMNINKTKLYENFIDIKNIANINLMICYKELINKRSIPKNIAFFIIIPIIIFHFIVFLKFHKSQKYILKNKIKDIVFGINNWDLIKEEKIRENKNKNKIIKKKKKILDKKGNKVKIFHDNKNIFDKREDKTIIIPSPIDYYYFANILKKYNPPIKKRGYINLNINNSNYNTYINKNISNKNKSQNYNTNLLNKTEDNQKIIKKVKEIMKYNDEEINNLTYKLALLYDKRTYCEYYISLLKTKHILIFSFYYNNDYNIKIIKIDLFFISFTIYYTINALFFNDKTMHKIYIDQGQFNFIFQLPQIIYSLLIFLF